jgi:hypothetical protein
MADAVRPDTHNSACHPLPTELPLFARCVVLHTLTDPDWEFGESHERRACAQPALPLSDAPFAYKLPDVSWPAVRDCVARDSPVTLRGPDLMQFQWTVSKSTIGQSGFSRWAVRLDGNQTGYWMCIGVTAHTPEQAAELKTDGWAESASDVHTLLLCTWTLRWCYGGTVYALLGPIPAEATSELTDGKMDPAVVQRMPVAGVPADRMLTPLWQAQSAMTRKAKERCGEGVVFTFDCDVKRNALSVQLHRAYGGGLADVAGDADEPLPAMPTPTEVMSFTLPAADLRLADCRPTLLMWGRDSAFTDVEPGPVFPLTAQPQPQS